MTSYECKICQYKTNKKSNINTHNKSRKHMDKSKELKKEIIEQEILIKTETENNKYECQKCRAQFKYRQGLLKHNDMNRCKVIEPIKNEQSIPIIIEVKNSDTGNFREELIKIKQENADQLIKIKQDFMNQLIKINQDYMEQIRGLKEENKELKDDIVVIKKLYEVCVNLYRRH
jgi:hypothetical protein